MIQYKHKMSDGQIKVLKIVAQKRWDEHTAPDLSRKNIRLENKLTYEVFTMEKKMTYVEAITTAMESADLTPEVTARLNDLINSLTKKTVSKAQREKQERAEVVKSAIAEAMTSDWIGLADIMASVPAVEGMTAGQIVPLLTALRKDGIIEAEKHKGKMEYRLACAEAVEE